MQRAFETGQICLGEEGESSAALPLLAGEVPVGVLEVKRAAGPPFSDAEIELLYGLAYQSAFALQAARQVETERWRIEQLSLVRSVSAQIASLLDLEELCQRVAELILETFGYYYVALFTLEPDREVLRWRASAGPLDTNLDRGETSPLLQIRLGDGIIGHVAQTGVEILADDVEHEPRYRPVDVLPETRSELALPLKIGERILGVLDVQYDEPAGFDETDLLVLRALADQIALAVEDARLYGDLRRRADQLAAVGKVGRAVASILDLDALLAEVVALIQERFGYPFVYLFTVDRTRGRIIYRAGRHPDGQAPQEQELTCSLDDSNGIVPWVACHGETVMTSDASRDPRYDPQELLPADARAELAVPLVFGGKVLGVLDVQSDRQGAFGDEDRFLFEALADSVAIAVRNANLYRSERWRRQVADSLREVAGILSAGVGLDQVLDAILTELERTLPCDAAAIWLLQEENLCLAAVHGHEAEVCVGNLLPDTATWLHEALYADEPVVRTPQSPSEPLGASLGFPPDYSAIAAPLSAGDRRLGVLSLVHSTPGRYGTAAQEMTATFANHAAVAIENARLYEEAHEQALVATVMVQVAETTRSLTTLDQVLETVVHLVPTLAGLDRCAIQLWNEEATAFASAAAYGFSAEQQATFDEWQVAPGEELAFDELRLTGSPIFIYDVATDPKLSGDVVWALGFESLLLLPLLAQDEVLGVMLVDYQGEWAGFGTDERLAIIQGIAHQAAAAVERTRLREDRQEEAYVSAALLQVAQAVASLSELDDVLSTIVRIAPILVGVERCVIFLWDAERAVFQLAQAYGLPERARMGGDGRMPLLATSYAPGDFPLLDAARERDSVVVHSPGAADDATEPRIPLGFLADFVEDVGREPYSLLAVPLSVKGNVLGVMMLEEAGTSHRSRERRMEIITGIAQQAAIAVQNDLLQQEMAERERLERELQLAHEIQQTFIPRELPVLDGWELAATWRAARQVAGDFYDLFELPDDRLGLVIADVADKGMPAALFMALTRTLMRATARPGAPPGVVLARVNDLLVPDAQQGMFVTALYAVLSLGVGELVYANAGHNLPLLLRQRTGELEQLDKGGMALGVVGGNHPVERKVDLELGDCLIFYTDGVTEAFSVEGDIYGEDRLREAIRGGAGGSAQEMLEAIEGSVSEFVGDTPPSDDLTLMVLRRCP
jgi:GAF domain-containing protein